MVAQSLNNEYVTSPFIIRWPKFAPDHIKGAAKKGIKMYPCGEDDGGAYEMACQQAAQDEYNAECNARGQAEAECQAYAAEQEAAQAEAEQAQTVGQQLNVDICPICNGNGWMDDAFGYPVGTECQTCHGTGKRSTV